MMAKVTPIKVEGRLTAGSRVLMQVIKTAPRFVGRFIVRHVGLQVEVRVLGGKWQRRARIRFEPSDS